MARQLILQTPLSECRLDVFQGVEIISRYQQFAQVIARKLGPDRLLVLAEPVVDKPGDRINWYANAAGEVKPFERLSLAEQGAALTAIGRREEEINQLARDLKAAGDSNSVLAGELLGRLFTRPNNQGLFVVGGQPVLAAWGLHSGLTAAAPVVLEEERPAAAPPPPPPPPVARMTVTAAGPPPPKKGCPPWWLLFVLAFLVSAWLSFLILYFLFPNIWPVVMGRAPVQPLDQPSFDRDYGQAEALRRELERLKTDYQERLGQCRPGGSAEADWPAGPAGQPLEIPEDAAENNDLSFLEGCWRSVTGLYNTKSGLPVVYLYCFDKNGQGAVEIQERDQQGGLIQVCRARAQASFDQERLKIEEDGPECLKDNSRYSPSEVSCKREESGLAGCDGLQKNPQTRKTNKWAAQFERHPGRP